VEGETPTGLGSAVFGNPLNSIKWLAGIRRAHLLAVQLNTGHNLVQHRSLTRALWQRQGRLALERAIGGPT
jgi:2-keto-4-pentenoate hydratase